MILIINLLGAISGDNKPGCIAWDEGYAFSEYKGETNSGNRNAG